MGSVLHDSEGDVLSNCDSALLAKMSSDQQSLEPRFKKQQNDFLYWSAQLKAILKEKHVWNAVQFEKAASVFVWYQDET